MKDKTACFTGHRKVLEPQKVYQQLIATLENYILEGYIYFGAGGALGFDTFAAEAVLELRNKFPHIKLILVLPCKNQTAKWNKDDVKRYESIKQQADKVIYTSESYYDGCMQRRNRHLVDNSSLCICYLSKNYGGTAYTVNYAKAKKLTIINLAD